METPVSVYDVSVSVQIPEDVQLAVFRELLSQGEFANFRNMVALIKLFRNMMHDHGHNVSLLASKRYCDEILRRMRNWVDYKPTL